MKGGDPLIPLVPCTLKSGKGFANGSQSKSSSFSQSCKDNYQTVYVFHFPVMKFPSQTTCL